MITPLNSSLRITSSSLEFSSQKNPLSGCWETTQQVLISLKNNAILMSAPIPARHFSSMLLCVPWHEGYFKVTLGLLSKHPPFSCPWILVLLCLYPRMIWSIAFDCLWFSGLCPKSISVSFCQIQFPHLMELQGHVFEVTLTPAVTLSTVTCHKALSTALREPRVCASPRLLRSGYLEIFWAKRECQTSQRRSGCGELIYHPSSL